MSLLSCTTRLLRILEEVRKEAPDLPTQQLQVFLTVAQQEGRSISSVQEACELRRAAGSRCVRALYVKTPDSPGLGWVRGEQNPMNLREKQLYLTDKGREVLHRILAPLN